MATDQRYPDHFRRSETGVADLHSLDLDFGDAAGHLLHNIKEAAQPVLAQGRDAVVSVILDGENAWEYYPKSGREFLRRFYDRLQREPGVEAVTVSEAIERHRSAPRLNSLVPGSWINANFNVWIGAPEDNRAWDYLYNAREFYDQNASRCTEEQRKLAFQELLIAEGSDWNWWYGPEHHSANDREFDELYRRHLSNVYQALGAIAPDYLSQPIAVGGAFAEHAPQTAYIHPHVTGDPVRYFEWLGAASHTADSHSGAMHGKVSLLNAVYAGIDESRLYGRLDISSTVVQASYQLLVNIEAWSEQSTLAANFRLVANVEEGKIVSWNLTESGNENPLVDSALEQSAVAVALVRSFEFKLPLALISRKGEAKKLRLRFSVWRNRLPLDALPAEGWLELQIASEEELLS